MIRYAIFISTLLTMAGCQPDPGRQFADSIAEHRGELAHQPLALSSLTKFSWDELYWFGPYTIESQFQESLGSLADNAEIRRAAIGGRDDISLVVFIKNKKVAQVMEVPRALVDLKVVSSRGPFSFEHARLQNDSESNAVVIVER